MARIVFTTFGSLGDLHPMLPVAERLRERGHDLTFAVPSHLAEAVADEGFDCSPIATTAYTSLGESRSPSAVRARIAKRLPSLLESTLDVLRHACGGADLIVTHPLQLAAAMTARKLGLRWITLTAYPGLIPSAYTVPQPHWLPALRTPVGRAVNRLTWRIFRFGLRHLSGDIINATLDAEGLARDDEIFMPGGLSPHLTLVLSSPAYSPRQPDWPAHIKVTGYTPWDEPRGWRDPPELDRFLSEGGPPVLITTSTAGERDAPAFFASAVRALAHVKKRGILLLGSAAKQMGAAPGSELGPGVVAWPYLPLSRLVPRSSLVVHHGGVGTSLTTIRHGRAAVAVPAIFDQWYNATRIKSLGVGRVLPWKQFTADRLATELETIAASPSYADRARRLGALIAGEDGAGRACDEIESLLSPVGD
jgi:rhamnosyltransferase subunit B